MFLDLRNYVFLKFVSNHKIMSKSVEVITFSNYNLCWFSWWDIEIYFKKNLSFWFTSRSTWITISSYWLWWLSSWCHWIRTHWTKSSIIFRIKTHLSIFSLNALNFWFIKALLKLRCRLLLILTYIFWILFFSLLIEYFIYFRF